jgi:hypothetical protein
LNGDIYSPQPKMLWPQNKLGIRIPRKTRLEIVSGTSKMLVAWILFLLAPEAEREEPHIDCTPNVT